MAATKAPFGDPGEAPFDETLEGTVVEAEIVGEESLSREIVESHAPPHALTPEDLGIEMPDDPAEREQVLVAAVETARNDADEYLETLQRLAADFENFRKRAARDQKNVVEHATQRLISHLMPALDSFDAAMAVEPQTPTEEKILDGMRGTHSQLMETLRTEGLEPIEAVGKAFDPALHEAISAPAAGDGDLVVTQELRRGYTLRDRVIRASLVAVDHA